MDKEELRKIAYECGADFVGFGRVASLMHRRELLEKRPRIEFEQESITRRTEPSEHFEGAKSILCILVSYTLYHNKLEKDEIKCASSSPKDYHIVMNEILSNIGARLEKEGIKSKAICDTQGLLDREMAIRCGAGFFGKNTFIINEELGTSHNIGYLLIDKEFCEDPWVLGDCADCDLCVRACPTGALQGDYTMRADQCLSYITQSKHSNVTTLNGCFYGCDICQRACPYNNVLRRNEDFIFHYEDFEGLSNRAFRKKFRERDFSWVGKNTILRNIEWIKKERGMKKVHELEFLQEKIDTLKEEGTYKTLPVFSGPNARRIMLDGKEVVNLCSNNYLGFANHPKIKEAAAKMLAEYGFGSGAVRTIVGNMDIHEQLEEKLAKFKKEEAVMLYQSGFNCNAGTIQAITDKGDLIISDELNHASIIDGVRLSKADKRVYKHSDMEELKKILEETKGQYKTTLIITDGVFSMDGDLAKLPEIVELAEAYGALTYVDDAHGSGVLGERGRGTVDHFGLHGRVDFIIGTLSKALGGIGGYVAGKKTMKEWLINRGRPILFSTSLPPAVVGGLMKAIELLEESNEYTEKLWDNAKYFKNKMKEKGFDIGNSETPITPVIIGDEAKTIEASKALIEKGVFVSPIVFPTVPKGTGRLRCMITAEHTREDLDMAVEKFTEVLKELNA